MRKTPVCLGFIAFALAFFLCGALLLFHSISNLCKIGKYIEIPATVTDFEYYSYLDYENNTISGYNTYVSYQYKNNEYSNILVDNLSSKKSYGEIIKIRISPEDPGSPITLSFANIFFPLIGSVPFIAVSIFFGWIYSSVLADELKINKNNGNTKIFYFRKPSKKELLFGLIPLIPMIIGIVLAIKVSIFMIIATIGFGVFFFFYIDAVFLE